MPALAATANAARAPKGKPLAALRISPLVLVLCAVLLILILPPTIFIVFVSLHETAADGSAGPFTWENYRGLFQSRFFLSSLANTALFACGTAIVSITVGTVQALIVERTNTPGRSLMLLSAIVSLGVPHVLYVVAWLLILGRAGPANAWLTSWFGVAPINVYSLGGMILIEGIGFAPLVFMLMSPVLRSIDASFEEASMMSGARPFATLWKITLRMGLPGLFALLLLVVARSFEAFEVPALVGLAGNVNVLTTDIYQSARAAGLPDYGQSGAYAVCLSLIVGLLLLWYRQLANHAHRYQTITGKGYRPRLIDIGRWRYLTSALLLLSFFLVTGLPILMLVFASLQPFYDGVTAEALGRLTLQNYAGLFRAGDFLNPLLNSLILGISTASAIVPFAALCAWLAARRKPGAWLLDQIGTLPLAYPAIVLSIAFLIVFVNAPLPLYGTLLSVIIASWVRYLAYAMRYAFAGVMQIHAEIEDASMMSGARTAATFLRIVLPLLSGTLVSAWLLIFLLSVQSVALPLLLVGPGTSVLAVTLFDLWQNGQVTELAAMGVAWAVLVTSVSAGFYLSGRPFGVAVAR